MTSTAAIIGSTGLVGSHILSTILNVDAFKSVYTISRRQPKGESPKLTAIVEADTTKWTSSLSSIAPPPSIVISALGTTRAQAGGIANQWKIDHDLNVELAKSAHAAGAKTFMFISSAGIRGPGSSYLPYSQMKVGVENSIKELNFDQAIILQPGLLLGERETPKAANTIFGALVRGLGKISQGVQDKLGQEADVIARAAVRAAMMAAEGKAPDKYWVIGAAEIIKLGREEWKS
ncbi:NAD(P)-binding protein [Hypomontagnella monticulosa]|nr:NAD(P)-binding protein [Hypomontagnella monticulosa]